MPAKPRVDLLLVERKLAESREKAKRLILAGSVFIGTQRVEKPSETVAPDAALEIRSPSRFVSRGGEKLDAALDYFQLDVRGLTAVDLGASTGGFTDCLLQRGAERVFAVDVGRGQLADKLRRDPRVILMEKVNARDLRQTDIPAVAEVITIDVAFIGLTKVLPAAYNLVQDGGTIIALIKPQFEAGRKEVGKGGVVKDAAVHQRVVAEIELFSRETLGASVIGTMVSPLVGPAGNKEFFICLKKPRPAARKQTEA